MRLGFCLPKPAEIQWMTGGSGYEVMATRDPGIGAHVARLPQLAAGTESVHFRLAGPDWDDRVEYEVRISGGS
jgi:hypothetical protein